MRNVTKPKEKMGKMAPTEKAVVVEKGDWKMNNLSDWTLRNHILNLMEKGVTSYMEIETELRRKKPWITPKAVEKAYTKLISRNCWQCRHLVKWLFPQGCRCKALDVLLTPELTRHFLICSFFNTRFLHLKRLVKKWKSLRKKARVIKND